MNTTFASNTSVVTRRIRRSVDSLTLSPHQPDGCLLQPSFSSVSTPCRDRVPCFGGGSFSSSALFKSRCMCCSDICWFPSDVSHTAREGQQKLTPISASGIPSPVPDYVACIPAAAEPIYATVCFGLLMANETCEWLDCSVRREYPTYRRSDSFSSNRACDALYRLYEAQAHTELPREDFLSGRVYLFLRPCW